MLQDLYATILTLQLPPGDLLKLLEDVSATSPRSTGEKATVLSLLETDKRLREIKIYSKNHNSKSSDPSIAAESNNKSENAITPTQNSFHRFKYHLGFLPTSLPESNKPYIFWANIYFKSAPDIDNLLSDREELVKKVRENEPGTLCYLWLRDVDNEKHICVFELYKSKKDLEDHAKTEWGKKYSEKQAPYEEHKEFIGAEWKGGFFLYH